ncbi:DNA translocase FtsK [Candidatus Saccharibacteria bacterium CPR2]|nr:DNA translocase FtsK [Candidatus Saccharibacteria bacterium CPR2]
MAKKRKSRKAKQDKGKKEQTSKPAHILPDGFWPQAVAFILGVVVAPVLIFAMFGLGGNLPETLLIAARWLIGFAAFLLPLVFVFVAVKIFTSEDAKLPGVLVVAIIVFLTSISGFFHLFVDKAASLNEAYSGNGGGVVGHLITTGLLTLIAPYIAGIILICIAFIALLFILRIEVKTVLKPLLNRFSKETGDEDLEKATSIAEENKEFQLNENVPVQKHSKFGSVVASEGQNDDHDALTSVKDPDWEFPSLDLLNKKEGKADAGDVKHNAKIIKDTLADFGIDVAMEGANIGPRVTQYMLRPPNGVRLTKITALENNLALNLAAQTIRIEAPIPGKRAVGVEVPNEVPALVRMYGILESKNWQNSNSPLSFTIGKDIAGDPIIGELDKMPHLLIAGATGSGKSVMINSLLTSFMFKNSPADLRLILVDPKQVELTPYNNIPHLLTPVITEPEKCISALKWAVAEMERRYSLLAEAGKRNIAEYNRIKGNEGMPYIVIVIDELADIMMVAARDVEALIVRLAQKARAVGVHLVVATQRPSVDVITGLIKANIPARLAFTVTSQVDSRTIIDQIGAEKLLGQGDMLMSTSDLPKPRRVQGVMITEKEVNTVSDHVRMQRPPEYDDEIITQPVQIGARGGIVADIDMADDKMYKDAVRVVVESGKASASLLQRRLRVGYARAARLIEAMEEQGIISQADGARPRDVLVTSMDDVFSNDEPAETEQ